MARPTGPLRIGVDIGGTFTDLVILGVDGRIIVRKGTVKLRTFDGSHGSKVGGNPRLRAKITPQIQYLGQ